MGAVKDLMMRYCETVHPDSWDEQDKLFVDLMEGKGPGLEEMSRIVKEFEDSGRVPKQPALTLHRVTQALGIRSNADARPDG